ncbi:GDP-mannose 4,6-dehydratase [Galbitalea sp. SE-J8]|uniref:GDP-mannose 4,6-dehydratase n=1 Tax=Galbitalea sp. SE-J8 TaxID=3054952 RepID=UPI00259CA940|nr:GDP-mannose 4,6-dehydratase [Galbitalea sp. SE-J8]MDM4763268.1 GDP-mannose 4,6-dehydratase [Galbitalea sp. SE-J8]
MKSLVTGGAGFIGSHLVEELLARGDDVTVLDDLSTGSVSNLAAVRDHPRFQLVVGTILDPTVVHGVVSGCDRVFHLAAAVGVKLIIDDPLASLRTNIHGTENVLMVCEETGATLLLASTSEIYGKNEADRLHEDSDRVLGSTLKSRWSYASAKGIDEAFAHAYWSQFGLAVSIVRLFNTVGPRQKGRYGMVVPNLVGQALRGDPLTVFGTGEQTRCFSSVHDIVPALIGVIDNDATRGQALNLGGAHEISILDLARAIIRVTGSSSEIQLVPYDTAYGDGYEDMRRRVPDNTRAHDLVGFAPRTSIDEIVRGVAESLQSTVDRSDWTMQQARPHASTTVIV